MQETRDGDYIIRTHINGTVERIFTPPTPRDARPELLITDLSCSPAGAIIHPGDITCPAGSVITASAELRGADNAVVPVNTTFRMPIVARDGRERVVLATLVDGRATVTLPMPESGVWVIDETTLNSGLPAAAQMQFMRHEIYVVQV